MEIVDRVLKDVIKYMTRKSITVYFSNEEFEEIKRAKKDTSWHDFILEYSRKLKRAENNIKKGVEINGK